MRQVAPRWRLGRPGHRHPPCRGPRRRRRARTQAEPAALQGIARDSELPGQAAEQAPLPRRPARASGIALRRFGAASLSIVGAPPVMAGDSGGNDCITFFDNKIPGTVYSLQASSFAKGMATRGSRTPPTPRWAPWWAPVTGYIGNRAAQAPTIPAAPTPAPGRSLRTPQAGALPSAQEPQSPSACRCPRTTSSTTAANRRSPRCSPASRSSTPSASPAGSSGRISFARWIG